MARLSLSVLFSPSLSQSLSAPLSLWLSVSLRLSTAEWMLFDSQDHFPS